MIEGEIWVANFKHIGNCVRSERKTKSNQLEFYEIHDKEGFELQVGGGLLVALSYALDFHLLVLSQSCSQFKK